MLTKVNHQTLKQNFASRNPELAIHLCSDLNLSTLNEKDLACLDELIELYFAEVEDRFSYPNTKIKNTSSKFKELRSLLFQVIPGRWQGKPIAPNYIKIKPELIRRDVVELASLMGWVIPQ
jgi:hypothetical protein